MKKKISSLVIAASLTAPVLAEGFYAGADLGRANVKTPSIQGEVVNDEVNLKKNSTAMGVFAGYQFHPNIAVEVGYRDFGSVKGSEPVELNVFDIAKISGTNVNALPADLKSNATLNATLKANALHASILGIVPVSDNFSLYGRLGLARIAAKLNGGVDATFASDIAKLSKTVSVSGTMDKTTKIKPMIGLGGRFAVSKEFGVRAEYTHFGKIEDVKLSTLMVGADYRF
ncbi:outer membrane beta-barrel protein [Chitinimonas sp. PSY-7]|uniref:outer membrane beta-barrel protein n=1 Tax=Chitinimonas sp. PSY-7 TaxID=3459088 RepID=UPI00404035D4